MRRHNKPKVVWIPNTAQNSIDGAGRSMWSTANVGVVALSGGAPGVLEIPLVLDGAQSEPLNAVSSLSDIESSGYRLRRIVGKIFVFLAQTATANEDVYCITAGLIVRRTNNTTGASLAASVNTQDIDPDDIDNSMDPWIWRRSWVMSNGPTGTGAPLDDIILAQQTGRGPGTNFGRDYGSAFEGPHVDQKTARIIGQEERLFLDVSVAPFLISSGTNTSIVVVTNLRVLGSMRQNLGNRRNASR